MMLNHFFLPLPATHLYFPSPLAVSVGAGPPPSLERRKKRRNNYCWTLYVTASNPTHLYQQSVSCVCVNPFCLPFEAQCSEKEGPDI